jgi:hypothetical protein
MIKAYILSDITCHKCGGEFHKVDRKISYAVYECECGTKIRLDTGYRYNG